MNKKRAKTDKKTKEGLKEGNIQESECTTSAATTATVTSLGLSISCSTTGAPGFSDFFVQPTYSTEAPV